MRKSSKRQEELALDFLTQSSLLENSITRTLYIFSSEVDLSYVFLLLGLMGYYGGFHYSLIIMGLSVIFWFKLGLFKI